MFWNVLRELFCVSPDIPDVLTDFLLYLQSKLTAFFKIFIISLWYIVHALGVTRT